MARYLVLDMKEMDAWRMLAAAGAVLAIRYGHVRYPYLEEGASSRHVGSRNKR